MKLLRRLGALMLTIALLLGVLSPAAAAGDVYFNAVNDNLLPLTTDPLPVWSGGVLYVSYTMFDGSNYSHIRLGMDSSYTRGSGKLALYNTQRMLVFDLNNGTCYNDITGEPLSGRAILRNGRPYVPVSLVCSFFDLSYSLISIDEGYIVRLKSSAVVLDDAAFVDAASDSIARRLREYHQANQSAPITGVRPELPSDGQTGSDPIQDEPEEGTSAVVYLGFRCDDTAGLSGVLDAMDQYNRVGVFFFPADGLEREDDLLYRLIGSGHTLGLLAQGDTLAETRRLLSQGSAALERAGYTRPTAALVPQAQRDALEGEGWVCWDETVSAIPGPGVGAASHAASVIRRIGSRTARAYLTLDAGEETARVLSSLLRQLENRSYAVSVPLETRL